MNENSVRFRIAQRVVSFNENMEAQGLPIRISPHGVTMAMWEHVLEWRYVDNIFHRYKAHLHREGLPPIEDDYEFERRGGEQVLFEWFLESNREQYDWRETHFEDWLTVAVWEERQRMTPKGS